MIDKDVLLFEGSVIKGVSSLAKRINPYSGMKATKEQYEESFRRLAASGLGKLSEVKSGNNKKFLEFVKLSVVEIADHPELLDKFFDNNIKFCDYELNRRDYKSETLPQSQL